MSQTYFIIAIVGFSLAVLLVLVAVIMFFTLHIKQVRDDLTGKTAARAIAETRARAKTRKRTTTQAVKKYGWEKDIISTDDLEASSRPSSAGESDNDEAVTSMLSLDDDETETSLLDADEEGETTCLAEDEEEGETTVLSDKSKIAAKSNVFIMFLLAVLIALPASFAWAEGEPTDPDLTDPTPTEPEPPTEVPSRPIDPMPPIEVDPPQTEDPKVCVPLKLLFLKNDTAPFTPTIYTGSTKTNDLRLWFTEKYLDTKIISKGAAYLLSEDKTTFPNGLLSLTENSAYPITAYARVKEAEELDLDHIRTYDPDTDLTEPIELAENEVVQLPKICLDVEAPAISDITITANEAAEEVKDSDAIDAPSTLYAEYFDIAITAADDQGNGDDENSGIKSVKITINDDERILEPDAQGKYQVSVSADGSYSLADITVAIEDVVEHKEEVTLKEYFEAGGSTGPSYSTIEINNTAPSVAISGVLDGTYYNSSQEVVVKISDPLFKKSKKKYADKSSLEVVFTDVSGIETTTYELILGDYSNPSSDGVKWESIPLPCAEEGTYQITASYKKMTGPEVSDSLGFTIDYTKPVIGAVEIDATTPVVWDWVFAGGDVSLNAKITDNLSGIDESKTKLIVDGLEYGRNYDDVQGRLSAGFPARDQRIAFENIKIETVDKAANRSLPCALSTHEDKNFDDEIVGIIVDSAAPVLSVSYDNNNFQNGMYYNAERTATITIVEATFDLVKENDPRRIIATKTFNGSDSNVYAEDFEPTVDGNGAQVWVATIDCSTDGEYSINASFTDPAGKSATPYSDHFIVDTGEPMISVSFDNEEADNGWYYKAPRTATITVFDDNFSESFASVSTQANDASGAAVSAPGISGWSQVATGKWSTTVYFGQELHYAIQAACTDLAGNAGEVIEVPEFVIDMTAPTVTIERVENFTAYADKIAPLITFQDTNFQTYLCDVEVIAASKSESNHVYLKTNETETETSRIIDYANFDYLLANDDVYTMNATIKDLAGNSAEASVTFSVNRFGSNYTFSDTTKACIGSYLKESQDIVIIETNVSGLERSSVSMAQNDTVSNLVPGEDFNFAENTQVGWSQYTYTLPADLFREDAYYRVMLASFDTAGNYSENLMHGKNANRDDAFTVNFAVDGTSPAAALSNIRTDEAYFAPSQRVDLFMSDNLEAEKASLIVNSVRTAEWGAEDLAQNRAFTYDLPADEGSYTVKLEIVDKAGNTTTTSVGDVVVTNDIARYVLGTPAILYPLIAGVILTIGLTAIIISRLVIRHKEKVKRRIALGV